MSATVRGRATSSDEDHIRAGAAMDDVITMLIEIVGRALPPDAARANSAAAGAVELIVRSAHLKSMSNVDMATALGLGAVAAMMHRPDNPERMFYPGPVIKALVDGFTLGVESFMQEPLEPSTMVRQ